MARTNGGKKEYGATKKRIDTIYFVICDIIFFQRFIPEITGGPATLLHGGRVKGPYRISTAGGGCLGSCCC